MDKNPPELFHMNTFSINIYCRIFFIGLQLVYKFQDILTGKFNTTFETPSELKYEVGGNPSDDPVVNNFYT
jgi:hypothetical protein